MSMLTPTRIVEFHRLRRARDDQQSGGHWVQRTHRDTSRAVFPTETRESPTNGDVFITPASR